MEYLDIWGFPSESMNQYWFQSLAADALVVAHLAFILFVVAGGLLAFRWPKVIWLHLPALLWGVFIELNNWVCPLTPIEQELRRMAGDGGYQGGFIDHYLVPVIYPSGLTPETQFALGLAVLSINGLIYGWWIKTKLGGRES